MMSFPFLLSGIALLLAGCGGLNRPNAGCLACHRGIEHASPAHPHCVTCHGGDDRTFVKKKAHKGMLGGKNPSTPEVWKEGCGRCHAYQLGRVASTLMQTNAGMVRNIRLTWGEGDGPPYAARKTETFDAAGKPLRLRPVAELDTLGGDLYRKFCARCHVGIENDDAWSSVHAAGCAACHFPSNDSGTYQGGDGSVFGKATYSATHRLEPLPGNDVCTRCHNRSGRVALSYQGLMDGNNGLVPTKGGEPGPVLLSGLRNAVHIAPDVHFAKGLDCIDCHTSRDLMGDGFAYPNLYHQVEIRCEDCHGDGLRPPRGEVINRENDEALRESRAYKLPMRPGMTMVLTGKGRNYSNVFLEGGKVRVLGKRSGRLHTSKVITGTPAHTVAGHGRLECHACHSRTVVQCYGCHTRYDKSRPGRDFIRGEETPGAFSETEDYRTLYPFPLALNQRGRVGPVTPGCQTFVTVVEADGTVSRDEAVLNYRGKPQLRFAPFFSHNTGERAVGCRECHANPQFLGFGQGVAEGASLVPTLLCEKAAAKPLDGFLTLAGGEVRSHAAITREGSRPLDGAEVRRTLAVNLCLVCHERADDPIYRKRLDYRALDDPLHRRLLAGGNR